MELKNHLHDYTEAEFLEFLRHFSENKSGLKGEALEKHIDNLVSHFEKLVDHPKKSGILFYPDPDYDSPEGTLKFIKEWQASSGKPGFKPD